MQTEQINKALARINNVGWFESAGKPQRTSEQQYLLKMLEVLDMNNTPVLYARDFSETKDYLHARYDRKWMQYEDSLRSLMTPFSRQLNLNEIARSQLNSIVVDVADEIMKQVQLKFDVGDEYFPRVATGCAVETSYFFALESCTEDIPGKYFTSKFSIFEQGRWPLCVSDKKLVVF